MHKPALITLALLLAGCARYQPQPLAPRQMLADYEARSLDSPALQRYFSAHGQANVRTWDLNRLTLAAFYYSPELNAARAQLASALAAVKTASQRPNPTLSLPFQYQASAPKPWTYGLSLDIPIETAGKRGYRVAQTEQLSAAARLNLGLTAWQLRSHLRGSLLDLYAAERRTALLQQQTDSQQAIVALLERRVALGAASNSDVNQERITLAREHSDLAASEQQQRAAHAQIATLIGVPVAALEGVKLDLRAFERPTPALPAHDVRRQAILNRADLQIALAEYEASQSALQLEVARQYPNLSLGLGYSFDQGANKYSVSPGGLTLPLFNHNEGPIAEAEAKRKEAAVHVETLQDQALNETDSALQRYQAAVQARTLADTLLVRQTAAFTSTQHAVAQGAADRLALLQAQRTVGTDALAQLDATIQVQQTIGQLENAMQRPLDGAVLPVPSTEETHKS
ncbi:TolC family protein [Herbaspirillum huttiense]|uniref:TolC family protein n=1 Tax=Herbaspirillum huttiense TaxID=863372 RepID=UPI00382D72FC